MCFYLQKDLPLEHELTLKRVCVFLPTKRFTNISSEHELTLQQANHIYNHFPLSFIVTEEQQQ